MDRLTFRQLFSALPSPHMILDRDLRYVAANPAYEAATMRRESELVGLRIDEAFPSTEDAVTRLLSSVRKALETGEPDTLAYIPYAIKRPAERGGGTEERYWAAVHTPLFDQSGNAIFVLQNTVDITELVRLREAATVPFRILPGEIELVQRAREAEAALGSRKDAVDFRRLFESAPGMIAVLSGPEHTFTFANAAYKRFVGGREVVGLTVREALPELAGQGFFRVLDDVFASGRTHAEESRRILLRTAEQDNLEEAYLDFSYHPIQDAAGGIGGVFVQAYDRTEAIQAAQRQRLLLDELNHRVKNTLSSVQSIARQSFRGDYDPALAQASFDARIQALSKAHDVLSDRHWESAELKTILMQELAIYDGDRVSATGPLTRLRPKAAIAFAMIFHELASNAIKYGSLAGPGGDLVVRWSRTEGPDGRLSVDWSESGGEAPDARIRPAFGLKMLKRIITGELDGSLDLAFGEKGLICRFHVPMVEVEDFARVEAG